MLKRDASESDEVLRTLGAVLQQLAYGVRLEILLTLVEGGLDVSSLSQRLQLSMSVVSVHLGQLANCGLVERATAGRQRIYTLGAGARIQTGVSSAEIILEIEGGGSVKIALPRHAVDRLLRAAPPEPAPIIIVPDADRLLPRRAPSLPHRPIAP